MKSTFAVNHNEHVSNPPPFQPGVTRLTLSNAAALWASERRETNIAAAVYRGGASGDEDCVVLLIEQGGASSREPGIIRAELCAPTPIALNLDSLSLGLKLN